MPFVNILTDHTAQFTQREFPGQELIRVMPIQMSTQGGFEQDQELRAADFPRSTYAAEKPGFSIPTVQDFQNAYATHTARGESLIVLLNSRHLTGVFRNAQRAAKNFGSSAPIEVIDSETVSVGLGLLVEMAAGASAQGDSITGIKRMVLGQIPKIYALFLINGLSYIEQFGALAPSQAFIGEMLGFTPLYLLNRGRMVPIHKIRNSRHLIETICEFADEFNQLDHIALINGQPPFDSEVRTLRERLLEIFPSSDLSDHMISTPIAGLFGPYTLGVVLKEGLEDMD